MAWQVAKRERRCRPLLGISARAATTKRSWAGSTAIGTVLPSAVSHPASRARSWSAGLSSTRLPPSVWCCSTCTPDLASTARRRWSPCSKPQRLPSCAPGTVNASSRPQNPLPPTFPRCKGHTTPGYERLLADKIVRSVIVEFGTYAHERIMAALLADHWSEQSGLHPAHQALIKLELLECFAPESSDWIGAVESSFDAVLSDTLNGMTA